MPHKWIRDKPLRRVSDSDVATGEVFTPSDAVQNTFEEWLAPVEPEDDPEGSDAEDGVVDPTEYSVSDLMDEVSLSDLSDEERKDMLALEEANKDRSSVTEWLEP